MLEVEYENGTTHKKRKATFEESVGKFFDEEGNLQSQKFYNDLCVFFQKLSSDKKEK